MSTGARSGFGATLTYDSSGPDGNSFGGAVVQVISLNASPIEDEVYESTNMESPAGTNGLGMREYVPGLGSDGQVSGEINLLSDTLTTLRGLRQKLITWKITFPFTSVKSYVFNGILTTLGTPVAHNGKMTASFTIQVSGLPTYT